MDLSSRIARYSEPRVIAQRMGVWSDVARWAFYEIGATMCSADLGVVHGPVAPRVSAPLQSLAGVGYPARVLAVMSGLGAMSDVRFASDPPLLVRFDHDGSLTVLRLSELRASVGAWQEIHGVILGAGLEVRHAR